MEKVTLTITNEDGLHARPAAIFVQEANKFESDIELIFDGNKVNGKSIIGVMSLGAYTGDEITIIAKGIDEEEAIKTLEELITDGLKDI
ncbi:MAG TPA: HPr family phosphocarrier protein [Tissierellaceae bacterium]|nr:HPr family phosphocarrier protein [Tissierellaceae bacterium]